MKKVTSFILFVCIFSLFGQKIGRYPFYIPPDTSSGGAGLIQFSDDFNSYNNGTTLAGQGDWLQGKGVMTCNGSAIYPNSADTIMIYYNQSVNSNQYGQIEAAGTSSRAMGIGVRCSVDGHNGYFYWVENGTVSCGKIINGVGTQFGNEFVGNDIGLRLEVSGTTISCYIDMGGGYALHSGLSNTEDGTFTDSDLSSGYVSVMGLDASSIRTGDNFEGGEL